jgi:hypothetical protein
MTLLFDIGRKPSADRLDVRSVKPPFYVDVVDAALDPKFGKGA